MAAKFQRTAHHSQRPERAEGGRRGAPSPLGPGDGGRGRLSLGAELFADFLRSLNETPAVRL
jgi:hypothetical protein